MKAKTLLSLALVMALMLCTTAALAASSPSGGSIVEEEPVVVEEIVPVTETVVAEAVIDGVEVKLGAVSASGKPIEATIAKIDEEVKAVLQTAANDYVAANFPVGSVAEPLMSFDLTLKDVSTPTELSVNVAGVVVGEEVIVVCVLPDGTIEYIKGVVTADGQVKFTLKKSAKLSIMRVKAPGATGAAADAPKLPSTGNANNTPAMALLMLVGVVVLAVLVKNYSRVKTER